LIFFPSSAGFPGCPGPTGFPIRFILVLHLSHRTDPLHSEPASCPACQTQQLYHIPTALSVCGPPRTLCTSCTSCLEQPVLYRFTSLHCMSPSSIQRVHPSVCAHALSCRSFLSSLSRLLTCAVNTPYLSSISLHLRGRSFMSSTYPPSTQRVCSHSARSSWSRCRLFFLSLYCLDFRCPSGYPSHIHPSTPCRNIHMSLTCIPHTVHSIKPRSAFQKAPALYTERTSLHLLDPVPPICFVRFALSFLFLGI
jgi:hypothetical protein